MPAYAADTVLPSAASGPPTRTVPVTFSRSMPCPPEPLAWTEFPWTVTPPLPPPFCKMPVPAVLVEFYPQYRGRKYFVYNDEIIIVDDEYRIVAVIQV